LTTDLHVDVRLFARAKELLDRNQVTVALAPGGTVGDLRRQLETLHPRLAGLLGSSAIAVNRTYVDDDHALAPGDDVAIIPPVAGG